MASPATAIPSSGESVVPVIVTKEKKSTPTAADTRRTEYPLEARSLVIATAASHETGESKIWKRIPLTALFCEKLLLRCARCRLL